MARQDVIKKICGTYATPIDAASALKEGAQLLEALTAGTLSEVEDDVGCQHQLGVLTLARGSRRVIVSIAVE